jgi:integrase
MPRGAAVVRYEGARGVTWRVKYVDAAGQQVMETIGREADGWTERRAREALSDRLSDVRRKGYQRPKPITFADYSTAWLDQCRKRRDWRPRTAMANEGAVRRLTGFFGPLQLGRIRTRDVTAYVREALDEYAPATVNLDVSVLVDVFNSAIREELVEANPALYAERPKIPRRRWRILEPAEVVRVDRALANRVATCDPDQRPWAELARVAFLFLVLTGVRRSEFQTLRWRDVDLLEGTARVRDSKTEDGIRSIALSPRLTDELREHWRRSSFRGDDELVFCHPHAGTRYSPKTFTKALRAALVAAGVDGGETLRAFHDLRHAAITNDAASGSNPIAVMTKAGHSDMKTTKRYMHLAGVVFRDEAERLERRLLGSQESHESEEAAVGD